MTEPFSVPTIAEIDKKLAMLFLSVGKEAELRDMLEMRADILLHEERAARIIAFIEDMRHPGSLVHSLVNELPEPPPPPPPPPPAALVRVPLMKNLGWELVAGAVIVFIDIETSLPKKLDELLSLKNQQLLSQPKKRQRPGNAEAQVRARNWRARVWHGAKR